MSRAPALVAQANKHLKEAEKLSTKTMFRWHVDYDAASIEYERAAVLFRNAKDFPAAKTTFLKAAKAQYKSGALHPAAKATEQAANLTRDNLDKAESAQIFQQASTLYSEGANPDKAAECLSKAAKVYESLDNFDAAVEVYSRACEIFEEEDRLHMANDTFKAATNLLVKAQRFKEAVSLLERHCAIYQSLDQRGSLHKAYLSIIVLLLHQNDVVAADKKCNIFLQEDQWMMSEEYLAASQLLDAFNRGAVDALEEVTKKNLFNFLDNQIARIAKKLQVPEGLGDFETNAPAIDSLAAPPKAEEAHFEDLDEDDLT